MPYIVTEDKRACPVSKPWAVKNQVTGKLHGCHAMQGEAREQQKALYANVPDSRPKASAAVDWILGRRA